MKPTGAQCIQSVPVVITGTHCILNVPVGFIGTQLFFSLLNGHWYAMYTLHTSDIQGWKMSFLTWICHWYALHTLRTSDTDRYAMYTRRTSEFHWYLLYALRTSEIHRKKLTYFQHESVMVCTSNIQSSFVYIAYQWRWLVHNLYNMHQWISLPTSLSHWS